ncbi:hypothetical protein V1507DRAFT_507429 [Lipomyces tetrasporus]
MKDGTSLEDHLQHMTHLRDQLAVVRMDIDESMFIEVFLCSLTVFYNDALPSLLTAVDMTIDKMFSTLTHFRMQRQVTNVTDAAYSAQTNVPKTSSETGYMSGTPMSGSCGWGCAEDRQYVGVGVSFVGCGPSLCCVFFCWSFACWFVVLATNVTDAAYSAQTNVPKTSSETGYKSGNKKKFKARKFSGNGVSKEKPKCSHCGKRNHEAKDCRVRKYQLRQVQLMQQQQQKVNSADVDSTIVEYLEQGGASAFAAKCKG